MTLTNTLQFVYGKNSFIKFLCKESEIGEGGENSLFVKHSIKRLKERKRKFHKPDGLTTYNKRRCCYEKKNKQLIVWLCFSYQFIIFFRILLEMYGEWMSERKKTLDYNLAYSKNVHRSTQNQMNKIEWICLIPKLTICSKYRHEYVF